MRSVSQARSPMWTSDGTPRIALRNRLSQIAVTAPVATDVRRVSSAPSSAWITASRRESFDSAIGQLVIGTTSVVPCSRNPSAPSRPPTTRIVVRYPNGVTADPCTTIESTRSASSRPIRRNDSRTISTLASNCAAGWRCIQSQPPQPARRCEHDGASRSGDFSTIRTMRPLAKSFFDVSTSTSTTSPGNAPSMKTTRPSSSRASASPPATRRSGVNSIPPAYAPDLIGDRRPRLPHAEKSRDPVAERPDSAKIRGWWASGARDCIP